MHWIQLLGGGLLLYFGAEWFVGGGSTLALALRVPQILVGLTVVAYGTSAPEIVVSIRAAVSGHGDLALGNVIGSNIANIGLILGVSALIKPARVNGALATRELPMLLLTAALVPLVLLDGIIVKWEGAVLLLIAGGYTWWMVRTARTGMSVADAHATATVAKDVADIAGAPKPGGAWRAAAIVVVGLITLIAGGTLFIDGAVQVAKLLGMSDRIIGLTIVAVGTSLPELVTSIIAARKGHSDLAIGNVVGSNIFNVLLCLGGAAVFGTVAVPWQAHGLDLLALLFMTVVGAFAIRSARTITRLEGGVALGLYIVFVVLTLQSPDTRLGTRLIFGSLA